MTRPAAVDGRLLRRWPLPVLSGARGKEERGRVLIVGGTEETPGAVILAGIAALRAGAGTLQLATTARAAPAVAAAVPEARVIALPTARGEITAGAAKALRRDVEGADVVLIGPGMRGLAAAAALLRACRAGRCRATLVLDAAAIAATDARLALGDHPGGAILTPHAGEMARLRGISPDDVLARPLDVARMTAAELGAIVALKGERTFIVAPSGRALVNTAGNIGLGTSGSGDTLCGIVAGLAARGAEPIQAAAWGVHAHARAGDALARRMGGIGFLAREILDEIPTQLASLAGHATRPRTRR